MACDNRRDRLAAALRANLKRRKQPVAIARGSPVGEPEDQPAGPNTIDDPRR